MSDVRYYPVYLDLRGRLCTVLGGGWVAEEKVEGLLDAGARVRVITATVDDVSLARRIADGEVEHVARDYRDGDLQGSFMVFSERLGEAVHRRIRDECERSDIPVNVQDETEFCSFIAAALLRQGDLTVTISTAGRAPALAVRLKEELAERLGPHYARFLELAGALRAPLKARYPGFQDRKERWYRLVDSDVLDLLEHGDEDGATRRMAEIMGVPREEFAPELEDEGTFREVAA